MSNDLTCLCQEGLPDLDQHILARFREIRAACPALRQILVPDHLWLAFQEWDQRPPNDAHHRSILLLALDRGHLGLVTSPIHRYLIQGDQIRPEVQKQYIRDLDEEWLLYDEPIQRHQKARAFLGRLVELQIAQWLEFQGWKIVGLEALREGPDIEATHSGKVLTAFEVKFIGLENDDFVTVLNSLQGKPAGRVVSPYVAANYLVFRAYEAAKQLQRVDQARVALLVVDDLTWFRFQQQLDDNWINWQRPSFYKGDEQWAQFLISQRKRYPDLDADLATALQDMHAVWIVQRSYPYAYTKEYEITPKHVSNNTLQTDR